MGHPVCRLAKKKVDFGVPKKYFKVFFPLEKSILMRQYIKKRKKRTGWIILNCRGARSVFFSA